MVFNIIDIIPYLLVYKSTFNDQKISPKNRTRVIYESYTKTWKDILRKKRLTFWEICIGVNFFCFPPKWSEIRFLTLKMGGRLIHEVDLYMSKYGNDHNHNCLKFSLSRGCKLVWIRPILGLKEEVKRLNNWFLWVKKKYSVMLIFTIIILSIGHSGKKLGE